MYSFDKFIKKMNNAIGKEGRIAFLATVIIGLFAHAPALLFDVPNHDGLASMYFDQNMITSGRWFLSTACGISSYFSLPWLTGVLFLLYLGIASIFLVKLLKVRMPVFIILISALLTTFPTVASMFAYAFTMDGYMLGLMLSIVAVFMVDKSKYGFVFGGIALSLSMGIYQAYLPIAVLLSLYSVLMIFASDKKVKAKIFEALNYLYMGITGSVLYVAVLKILLAIQGKELATYQGISDAVSSERAGFMATVKAVYLDFFVFTIKGKILAANTFATAGILVLIIVTVTTVIIKAVKTGWLKSVWFYLILILTAIMIPLGSNIILFISKDVTYHLLMRYQWVFLLIIPLAFVENVLSEGYSPLKNACFTAVTVAVAIVAFVYCITDNIAYGNLQKKYEKTYAYCLRLADRIEQTEGYYQGIPIYMIGVVGDKNYPATDITAEVTDHMVGIGGDYLLYTGINYQQFMQHYMGITLNILGEDSPVLYYEDWYTEMPSFPAEGSIKIVDGVMCIKTENQIEAE